MQKDNILTTYFWVYIYYIVFLTLNNPLMITLLTLITLITLMLGIYIARFDSKRNIWDCNPVNNPNSSNNPNKCLYIHMVVITPVAQINPIALVTLG